MHRILALLLILVPAALSAQEGAILYDRSIRFGFEVPERMPPEMRAQIPAEGITSMLLFFNQTGSLMIPAPEAVAEAPEEADRPAGDMRRMGSGGFAARMRMTSTARSDQEVPVETYVRFEDGVAEETTEFMGRGFHIHGTRPVFQWRLTGEQSRFLDYTVYKATAVRDSSNIEAWFTPEIPIPAGPGIYGGLPGMILSLSVDDGHTVYSATEVNLRPIDDGVIVPPVGGEEVTREEYEAIVSEKLEELEMQNRSRRRGRGGEERP